MAVDLRWLLEALRGDEDDDPDPPRPDPGGVSSVYGIPLPKSGAGYISDEEHEELMRRIRGRRVGPTWRRGS